MKSEETKKVTPFRVHAKKITLTYSDIPINATEDLIIDVLSREAPDAEYVIGEEYHVTGMKHFHVVVLSPTKMDIRSCEQFNFTFQEKEHRCEIKGVRNLKKAISYACKEGDYISNIKNLYCGVLMPIDKLVRKMAELDVRVLR